MVRDEFSSGVKDALGKRVNLCCSNPNCGIPTSGPHSDPKKFVNIGVAAHITAASPGGPRFDASINQSQRASADNGIWLCQSCAKLIDNDASSFPVELLHAWKKQAEAKALQPVNAVQKDFLPQPVAAIHVPVPRIQYLAYEDARKLLVDAGWQPKVRHWSDKDSAEINSGNGPYFWNLGFHEILSASPTGVAACTFSFRDAYGNILLVSTEGEVDPDCGSKACVNHWRFGNDGM